jgi:hypothetical protein
MTICMTSGTLRYKGEKPHLLWADIDVVSLISQRVALIGDIFGEELELKDTMFTKHCLVALKYGQGYFCLEPPSSK